MRVALFQIASPDDESVEERRARVDTQVRHEDELGSCDLLVLPELWGVGAFRFDAFRDAAELLEGPTVTLARAWASQYNVSVHTGSFVELGPNGELFNSSVVIDPSGAVIATYRKVHLFGADEAHEMTPGDDLAVVGVGGTSMGLTTCYDLRFPELFRSILDAGATSTIVCASWPQARLEHWRLLTSARAVEDQMYVLACNSAGSQNGAPMAGQSRVVDPWGTVVAQAGPDEGFLYAEIDPGLPDRTRAKFPAIADRRWPPRV